MIRLLLGSLLVSAALLTSLDRATAADPLLEIDAGASERRETPVVFPVPASLADHSLFWLKPEDDRPTLMGQRIPGDAAQAIVILDQAAAGSRRRFRITPVAAVSAITPGATCDDDGQGLTLRVGNQIVLRYNSSVIESPPGLDTVYRRSGHIHPLQTPTGRVVTDDFAPDHAHQHGVFFAWVNTTFDGHHVDFWNQKEKTGRVRHLDVLEKTSGPVFAQFRVQLRHEDITGSHGPTPALDETWLVRTYKTTTPFLVDIESRQSTAGARPLTLNKYHYGGFGLRANRELFDPSATGENPPDPAKSGESDFLTSDGKHRGDGNHTRPRWVDLSGKTKGEFAGVAVLDHPDNYRFPQPVRLHPNKPYFSISPPVLGSFTIEPGQSYLSRYRLDVHDGRPDALAINRHWSDYATPPSTQLVKE